MSTNVINTINTKYVLMRPVSYIEVGSEEWPLVLLALDNYSPIRGTARFHMICCLYHYLGYKYEGLICGPFSYELDNALRRLNEEYLIRIRMGINSFRTPVKVYELTEAGKIRANRIIAKIRRNNILLEKIVIRRGSEVLSELEAIKKTYKDKPLLFILNRILKLYEGESYPYWIKVSKGDVKSYIKNVRDEVTYILSKTIF